jgi:hypothetical protein
VFINKFSLRLNDPKIEQMYNQQVCHNYSVMVKKKTLICSISAFVLLIAEFAYLVVQDKKNNTFSGKMSSLAIFTVLAV